MTQIVAGTRFPPSNTANFRAVMMLARRACGLHPRIQCSVFAIYSPCLRLAQFWHRFNLPFKGSLRRGDSRHLVARIPKSQTGILHDTLPHESLDLGSTRDTLISPVPLVQVRPDQLS
jgi:hypothetical protein